MDTAEFTRKVTRMVAANDRRSRRRELLLRTARRVRVRAVSSAGRVPVQREPVVSVRDGRMGA